MLAILALTAVLLLSAGCGNEKDPLSDGAEDKNYSVEDNKDYSKSDEVEKGLNEESKGEE